MGASQLPGVRRGMGASQLWSWVLLLSTFFFWGARGESASGGAKGNGGESALELGVVVVYRLACPTFDTCQEGILSGRDFVRKGFCQGGILSGRDFVRKEFCQAGILSGRNFVRKDFCQEAGSARNCQEAGSARKEFCQEAGSARKEFCQEGFLSGSGLCRKEFCQERFLSGSGLCQEGILSGKVFVRKRAVKGG